MLWLFAPASPRGWIVSTATQANGRGCCCCDCCRTITITIAVTTATPPACGHEYKYTLLSIEIGVDLRIDLGIDRLGIDEFDIGHAPACAAPVDEHVVRHVPHNIWQRYSMVVGRRASAYGVAPLQQHLHVPFSLAQNQKRRGDGIYAGAQRSWAAAWLPMCATCCHRARFNGCDARARKVPNVDGPTYTIIVFVVAHEGVAERSGQQRCERHREVEVWLRNKRNSHRDERPRTCVITSLFFFVGWLNGLVTAPNSDTQRARTPMDTKIR